MTLTTTTTDKPRDAWADKKTLEALTRQDIWALRREFLERLWPDVADWQVLEVGSGPAHDSLTFAERGAAVTALDCSETGLALAERFYAQQNLTLKTVAADARKLPFENGEFDLSFNAGVLEHFTDDQLERVMDEMIRVVRPGGHVLAFMPNRLNVFYQANLRKAARHSYDFERAFTAAEMKARFEARGLVNVQVSGVHVHPAFNYVLPSWLPKHHRLEPWAQACFGWLERRQDMNKLKSVIGQDFVVWAKVPQRMAPVRSIADFGGGPAIIEKAAA